MTVKELHQPGEVGQRPGQPVDLVNDDYVDLTGFYLRQQRLQGGPLQGGS
jgi:hypothetical protein